MLLTKQNKKLIYLLLGLIVLTLWVSLADYRPGQNDIDRTIFAQDTASMHRIVLSNSKNKMILNKKNKFWLNQNQQLVEPQKLYFMLSILSQNRIKQRLTEEVGNRKYEQFKANEVQIQVDDHAPFFSFFNNKKTKTYWTQDHQRFYSVGLEGSNVQLAEAFSVDSLYWKPTYLFARHLRQLSTLAFENKKKETLNYRLKLTKGDFYLDENKKVNKEEKKKMIVQWLQALSGLKYTDYLKKEDVHAYDSLLSTKTPEATLQIERRFEEQKQTFRFYPKLKGDQYHIVDFDHPTIIARINSPSLEIIERFKGWITPKRN